MHSRFLGSAFRNKIPNEKNQQGIEQPLKESGLLGKDPTLKTIIRSNSVLLETPSKNQETAKITRPKTRQNKPNTTIKSPNQANKFTPQQLRQLQDYKTPRRGKNEKLESKVIEGDFPNVFYGRILQPTEPPAESNFAQLSELLDRLIDSEIMSTPNSYNKIFGDIVRQYYIECSAQGELLSKCRDFFNGIDEQIDDINDEYTNKITSLEKHIKDIEEESKKYGPEAKKNTERSKTLTKTIEDMRNDMTVLINHHDSIVKQVGKASKEASSIKEEMMQLDNRIKDKKKTLMELNNELRTLDTLSSDYSADTLRFSENLKQIRQQYTETVTSINNTNDDMSNYKLQILALDEEITNMTKEIEKARIIPPKTSAEIQCDLISRRLFSKRKDDQEKKKIGAVVEKKEVTGDLYQKILEEFRTAVVKPSNGDSVDVGTYDEFSKLKKIIIEHDKEFRMDEEEIKRGQSGKYIITPGITDYLRLYASRIASTCIHNACKKLPHDTKQIQTLNPQVEVVTEVEKKGAVEKTTHFLSLLQSDYSKRSPRRLNWILEEIRQIYDAKTVQDKEAIENRKPIMRFSQFIYNFGKEKMKLDFLTDQYCWDIYISSHEHADRALEVELFVSFIDEEYNEEQLAFFLRARTDCIKVGCSVSIKTRDQLEVLNEYYLSQDQIDKALRRWWAKRYQRKVFLSILDLSIARPAIHLESTKRYVAMHDILQICVEEYQNDIIARLNEQLMQYRVIPRLNSDQFANLVVSLIPKISQEQIEEFYRATVTKAKARENIDIEDFKEKFHEGCLLYHQNLEKPEQEGKYSSSGVSGVVEQLWIRSKKRLTRIIEFFRNQIALQPDNYTLKVYFDDATRYISMLNHSLTTKDNETSAQHYLGLIMTIDVMYSSIGYVDYELFKPSLISIECAIRESWLDSIINE